MAVRGGLLVKRKSGGISGWIEKKDIEVLNGKAQGLVTFSDGSQVLMAMDDLNVIHDTQREEEARHGPGNL